MCRLDKFTLGRQHGTVDETEAPDPVQGKEAQRMAVGDHKGFRGASWGCPVCGWSLEFPQIGGEAPGAG